MSLLYHHIDFLKDFTDAMDSRPTTPTTASDSAMTPTQPSATPEPYAHEWHITVKADEHAGAIDALFNCIRSFQSGAEPIGGTCPRSMGNRQTYDVVKVGREGSTQPSATPRTDAVCIPITETVTLDYCQLEMLARTLETELAAAKAECERLRGLLKASTVAHSHDIAELARLRAELAGRDAEYMRGAKMVAESAEVWQARAEKAEAELAEQQWLKECAIKRTGEVMAEVLSQAALLGRSAEREADLMGKLSRAEHALCVAQCPHIVSTNDGTHYCALAESTVAEARKDSERFNLLATLLEDVNIGDIDPTKHRTEDNEWPDAWRDAIDAAMTNSKNT